MGDDLNLDIGTDSELPSDFDGGGRKSAEIFTHSRLLREEEEEKVAATTATTATSSAASTTPAEATAEAVSTATATASGVDLLAPSVEEKEFHFQGHDANTPIERIVAAAAETGKQIVESKSAADGDGQKHYTGFKDGSSNSSKDNNSPNKAQLSQECTANAVASEASLPEATAAPALSLISVRVITPEERELQQTRQKQQSQQHQELGGVGVGRGGRSPRSYRKKNPGGVVGTKISQDIADKSVEYEYERRRCAEIEDNNRTRRAEVEVEVKKAWEVDQGRRSDQICPKVKPKDTNGNFECKAEIESDRLRQIQEDLERQKALEEERLRQIEEERLRYSTE